MIKIKLIKSNKNIKLFYLNKKKFHFNYKLGIIISKYEIYFKYYIIILLKKYSADQTKGFLHKFLNTLIIGEMVE